MNHNVLTNPEIIEKLKIISGSKSASELARKLGTERQNLKSYENKNSTDLNNRIISLLMKFIDDQELDSQEGIT
jgi:transcriptional regulator